MATPPNFARDLDRPIAAHERDVIALPSQPSSGLTRRDLMTPAEVAELLRIPLSTVGDWARRGILPSRKLGRHRRFVRAEVERWIVRSP
jgi:excisionase family DNA binding protein